MVTDRGGRESGQALPEPFTHGSRGTIRPNLIRPNLIRPNLIRPNLIRLTALLLFLWLWPMGGTLAEEVAVVRLYYLPAETLIPRLREVFPPAQLSVSGLRDQLILRAVDSTVLDEARELVAALDQRPAQFRITLQSGAAGSVDSGSAGISGRISTSGSGTVAIEAGQRQLSTRATDLQTVTVMENSAVMIEQGELRPVITSAVVSPFGSGVTQDYQALGSGLRVTPRRVGSPQSGAEEIEIVIEQFEAQPLGADGRRVRSGSFVTRRLVRAGEWVDLGGVSSTVGATGSGSIHYSTRDLSSSRNLSIKVELLE